MKIFRIIYIVLGIAFFVCLGYRIGSERNGNKPNLPIETKVDTLFIYDTILVNKPISIEKKVVERVPVKVTDTLRLRDTLVMYLDREQVVWQDSLSTVYASGILPQVDSVKHFTKDRIIPFETQSMVKVKSRWGLGINAGYGVGKDGLTPYVGVGVSYNILSW